MKYEHPQEFTLRVKIKAKVCRAASGDHMPRAPVLIGRRRNNGKGYAWALIPPGNGINTADAADYKRGFTVAIAVPPALGDAGLDEAVAALVPWNML